jgi:GNAT superfamily N-acetyltransferase
MSYCIREVDGDFESDVLTELHALTFQDGSPQADYSEGFWWLAYYGARPVAFLGAKESVLGDDVGYFYRVGVDPKHRGNSLQLRLMRAMHAKARRIGWRRIVTDTNDNPSSANNIIRAGYLMWKPERPWSFAAAQYWVKDI